MGTVSGRRLGAVQLYSRRPDRSPTRKSPATLAQTQDLLFEGRSKASRAQAVLIEPPSTAKYDNPLLLLMAAQSPRCW